MYSHFLVARDAAAEWKEYRERMASMSSRLKEAYDLNANLESVINLLRIEVTEEKKKFENANADAVAAVERCGRALKRSEDTKAAAVAKEEDLNRIISNLEAKVKS